MLVQIVTVARVPMAAAAAILLTISAAASPAAWAVVVLLLLCEVTDMADGLLARRLNMASRFGALFDPYCDSVSRLVIFFGLASSGLVPLWLFLLMALRDISVAYIRIMFILSGRKASARISGKAKAWAQGLGAILLAVLWATAALGADPAAFDLGAHWAPTTITLLIAAVTLWSLLDYFGATQRKPGAAEADTPPPPAA